MKLAISIATLVAISITSQHVKAENASMDEQAIIATINTMTTAFAAGDIDAVMSTYAGGAAVVSEPGQSITGDAALRGMFAAFVESGVNFTYGEHEVVVAGDTALHLMSWTAPGPDGETKALSAAVLARQTDGSWKMVIDHPFADAVMHADH